MPDDYSESRRVHQSRSAPPGRCPDDQRGTAASCLVRGARKRVMVGARSAAWDL